ncbi:sulfatase-like hydrolase/transferase [Aeromonas taiwanensis]|uniref:sulfatase-like hydrolase/transferase n=1 Tax=Aeromonas taiwanensis TaxID=633417 RepID=UPI0009DCCF23|nr:sulfatase-like hydrolase/transferase [Aeromonas taiwanensis]
MKFLLPDLILGLALYSFVRSVFPRGVALALSLAIYFAASSISDIKQEHSGVPLVAQDIVFAGQGVSLYEYISGNLILILVVLVFVFCWAIISLFRGKKEQYTLRRLTLGCILPFFVLCKAYGIGYVNETVEKGISFLGYDFIDYNYASNIHENGFLLHLYQTAENIRAPQAGVHGFYKEKKSANDLRYESENQDVLFILCEACFTSQDSAFVTPMNKLQTLGFSQVTMHSPVYGGGTSEAEFELLTGLSSRVMPGIDYQAYAGLYRDNAETIASEFSSKGYATLSFHNYYDFFWRRNTVHPKFGFQASYFVYNMPQESWTGLGFPKDSALYDTAYKVYDGLEQGKKAFMFLITVETHGSYKDSDNDHGEGDYVSKMSSAISSLMQFIHKMEGRAKSKGHALSIFIVGDHKPSLARVFYDKGIFPENVFDNDEWSKGKYLIKPSLDYSDEMIINSVPMFFKVPLAADTEIAREFIENKPFFCLPSLMANMLESDSTKSLFWLNLSRVCSKEVNGISSVSDLKEMFELPLYSERLF